MIKKIKGWIQSFFKKEEQSIPKKYIGECAFQTGDMIAFSGKGTISNLIKKWTHSDISHVGCVLIGDNCEIYICESTTLVDIPDAINDRIHKGVQIHLLENRLKSYDGQAYLYPQRLHPSSRALKKMKDWLQDVHGQSVPYSTLEAIFGGVDITILHEIALFYNREDFSYLFCSELMAKVQKIKYIEDYPQSAFAHINPSEITPADLCESHIFRGRECEILFFLPK